MIVRGGGTIPTFGSNFTRLTPWKISPTSTHVGCIYIYIYTRIVIISLIYHMKSHCIPIGSPIKSHYIQHQCYIVKHISYYIPWSLSYPIIIMAGLVSFQTNGAPCRGASSSLALLHLWSSGRYASHLRPAWGDKGKGISSILPGTL